jgi:hypothetical protein
MLVPFRRGGDLHVIVADDAVDARAMIERQDSVVMIGRRNGMTQYRLPRDSPSQPPARPGDALNVAGARSTCNEASIGAVLDGDDGSEWECRDNAAQHEITVDVGRPQSLAGVVYSQGPFSAPVPAGLDIATSIDGLTWIAAPTGSLLGGLIEYGLANPRSLRATLSFPARVARYVRLRPIAPPGEFVWFVTELRVHAP